MYQQVRYVQPFSADVDGRRIVVHKPMENKREKFNRQFIGVRFK